VFDPQDRREEAADRSVPDIGLLRASARRLLALLDEADMTIATAESCTGGFVASLFTDIEGLSHCFERGYVTYSNTAKQQMLGIAPDLIEHEGAVSEAVARAMAEQSLDSANAGLALAVTGLAGSPDPGESEGPGVVYLAAALADRTRVERFDFGDRPRREVRNLAAQAAILLGIHVLGRGGSDHS
jgi:nicotinamide-nucleotide amidase